MLTHYKKYIYGISVATLLVLVSVSGGYFLGEKVQERNYEKKHLRAYKRGDQFFTYGYIQETLANGATIRVPAWHEVLQTLTEK